MKKRLLQFGVLLALMAGCLLFASYVANPHKKVRYIYSDAEGYYMYLPAVAVYGGDFGQIPVRTKDHYLPFPGTRKIFTKYSYGVALMQSPFYFGAYFFRKMNGLDPNVYVAVHYSWAILCAAAFYGVMGLFLLWKTLGRHFSSPLAKWFSLATILLGTNLLYYVAAAPGMSHVYSFFMATALVYLTPRFYRSPTLGTYLFGGFVAGLLVLIRPTNGVFLLYPLLFGLQSWGDLRERLFFFRKNALKLAAAAGVAALLWLPQLCYWHYLSGHWFMDAYYTESFKFWNRPLVNYVLFSYLNGYFIYNPVMLFPVVALFFMLKKNRLNSWATLLIFMASTYLFSSWWCWWFGGAYGHRCYVELLPFLAFPMAYFFERLFLLKYKWLKTSLLALAGLAVFYNFRMTVLYKSRWSAMDWTWEKYWEVFEKAFFL